MYDMKPKIKVNLPPPPLPPSVEFTLPTEYLILYSDYSGVAAAFNTELNARMFLKALNQEGESIGIFGLLYSSRLGRVID